ncbi:MAG: hypothetical protein ACREH8_21105 [Opitutaceae bacterium]
MPLQPVQTRILRLLAQNRNPDSYIAGATALHRSPESPRYSNDIDIFHDPRVSVGHCALTDEAVLRAQGHRVDWVLQAVTFWRAWVQVDDQRIKLEWAQDSAFRFFPVEPDPELGYRLHWADLATNKILAGAGRVAVRDFVDLVFLHEGWLSLGALAWAGTAKDPGLSPLFILNELVRNSRYRPEDLQDVRLNRAVTLTELKQTFVAAVQAAQELINRLPAHEVGCLYLDRAGQPVTPDPGSAEFAGLTRHFGSVRGSWPRVVREDGE